MQNPPPYPTELTDEPWNLMIPRMPQPKKMGRPPVNRRQVLNGLFYLLRAGCTWRLIPREDPLWRNHRRRLSALDTG